MGCCFSHKVRNGKERCKLFLASDTKNMFWTSKLQNLFNLNFFISNFVHKIIFFCLKIEPGSDGLRKAWYQVTPSQPCTCSWTGSWQTQLRSCPLASPLPTWSQGLSYLKEKTNWKRCHDKLMKYSGQTPNSINSLKLLTKTKCWKEKPPKLQKLDFFLF